MKQVTITFTDDQWKELEQNWDTWNDESYAMHAAYILRKALIKAGYIDEEN